MSIHVQNINTLLQTVFIQKQIHILKILHRLALARLITNARKK